MTDIYIDPYYGNDRTGDGSEGNPYKTVQKITDPPAILQPEDVVYVVDTLIGQPKYISELFDTTFWKDEGDSNVLRLMQVFQYAVFVILESGALETQLNWYTRLALNLQRFTSIFEMIAFEDLTYDKFRRRVIDVWLAFVNPKTKKALNSIVGAYSYLPSFIYRLPDYPDNLILGHSYLDQEPPEAHILTRAEYRAGIVSQIFDVSNIQQNVMEELLRILDLNTDIVPFRYVPFSTAEPSGYKTIQKGTDAFDKATLVNARYSDRDSIIPTTDDDGETVEIRFYPIDILSLGNDNESLEISVLDRILTDGLDVYTYYRFGASLDDSDSSWEAFTLLDRGSPFVDLENQYIQLRLTIQRLKRVDDYELHSIMVKGTPLRVTPSSRSVPVASVIPLIVSGGRSPYSYTMIQSQSGGTITAAGVYTAGNSAGVDKIRISDSQGNQVQSQITVFVPEPLALTVTEE